MPAAQEGGDGQGCGQSHQARGQPGQSQSHHDAVSEEAGEAEEGAETDAGNLLAERNDGDGSDSQDENQEGIPAGGCWAIALQKAGLFPNFKNAVLALDTTASAEGRNTSTGYTPGDAWDRRVVELTMKKEGYFLDPVSVSDLNAKDTFVINGVANDSFFNGKEWLSIFQRDDEEDNPRDHPLNWQHVVTVRDGALQSGYSKISAKWLHLHDGNADPEKGFFRKIHTVYKVKSLPTTQKGVQRGVKRTIHDANGTSSASAAP